jgi:hypothetical protein
LGAAWAWAWRRSKTKRPETTGGRENGPKGLAEIATEMNLRVVSTLYRRVQCMEEEKKMDFKRCKEKGRLPLRLREKEGQRDTPYGKGKKTPLS